jgi:hypothetical protein
MKAIKYFLKHELWGKVSNYHKGFLLTFFLWGNYFLFLWPNIFFYGEDGIYAGWIGVWGDWAAHNTYASRFVYHDISNWVDTHPLFINTKFTYPFLTNLVSGLLIRSGVDRVGAFVLPTIITTLILLWLMYEFYFRQLKSYKKAFTAIFVFMTSGGLGFIWFFKDLFGSSNIWETLKFPPDQYTQLEEGTVYWLNTITGQLIPQRAFLLGLTIGLFVLIVLFKIIKKETNTKRDYLYLALLGIVTSLLVLAHMHSFMVVFVVCCMGFIINWKKWKLFVVYGIGTGVPALYFYWLLYAGAISSNFFTWHPGWLANPDSKDMNFIYFWFINWGIFLPIAIWWGIHKKYWRNEYFLSAAGIFIVCNLFLLQPFDWDNSKLLAWVYLFWTIPVVDFIAFLWNKKLLMFRFLGIVIIVVLSLAGILDIYRITHTDRLKYQMYSNEDIQLASEFVATSDPKSVVLTSDKHNHWVSNLTGRQVLLGYRGWMWTYGIDDSQVYNDILDMYSGGVRAEELLQSYKVDYVVIGYSERFDYAANESFFSQNFELILSNSEYNVYKVNL